LQVFLLILVRDVKTLIVINLGNFR